MRRQKYMHRGILLNDATVHGWEAVYLAVWVLSISCGSVKKSGRSMEKPLWDSGVNDSLGAFFPG